MDATLIDPAWSAIPRQRDPLDSIRGRMDEGMSDKEPTGFGLAALVLATVGAGRTSAPPGYAAMRRGDDTLRVRLASGEAAPEETVAWVGACTKSGQCVDACPQKAVGLDAMLLVRIAKQRAINETRQLPAKQDPSYFPRIKAFARLQLTDEEFEKWL